MERKSQWCGNEIQRGWKEIPEMWETNPKGFEGGLGHQNQNFLKANPQDTENTNNKFDMKAKTFGPKAEVPKLRKHCFCSSTCEMKFSDNVFFMFGFKCWTVHVYMKSNVRHQARWQAVQLLKVRSVCKIKTVEQVQSQATNLLKLTNYIQETLFGIETVGGFASGTRMRCHMHTCIPATSWVA